MPLYFEFLSGTVILLMILVILMYISFRNLSSIQLEDKIKKIEEWGYPRIALLTFSLSSITTVFISSFGFLSLIGSNVPVEDHNPFIIYTFIFIVTIGVYYLTFKFFNRHYLDLFSINSLHRLNLVMELSGIFLLGLIIFISLGSESSDKDIDSLYNNFMVTIFILSFIAVTHYYTNKIISSKSDTKIKDEIAVSIEELTVESHNNRFVELEKQIEELKREQQAIAIKIAKPKGFVEKLIAILQIISSK